MKNKVILANWNGEEMPLTNVRVSVLDRAFLFGDAVYEVIRVYQKKLFSLDDHLDRLRNSLAAIKITKVDVEDLRGRLEKTVAHGNVTDGIAYLQVTRGAVSHRLHRYSASANMIPNVLIFVDHFDDPYGQVRLTGVSCALYPDIRWSRNDIKVTSLAANCMAAEYAYEQGCAEVILVDSDGMVTEGSHTSIFGVRKGVVIVAPSSTHVLPGITKKLMLELASKAKIPVIETRIKKADIWSLDEMFLAGTPEEILSIVRVDDRPIGFGEPGPITKKLQEEFQRAILKWLSGITTCA